jgi:hypothetical protein
MAQWVSPESSCLEQDDSWVVPRWRRRDEREKKINGKQTSIPYVGMLLIYEKHVWCLCPDGAYAPLSTVVKKEEINFVKKSILVAQTRQQQNNSKCNFELFLNLGCYFNCLFQDVMSGRNCFLPNFFSQKGKHENLGTLSMCGLTKVHLEC